MAYVSTPYVWVATGASCAVAKLNAFNGTVIGTYPVSHVIDGIAVDADGNVWVAHPDAGANSVTKLSGSTGAVIGTYSIYGGLVRGISIDADGNVWVANKYFGTVTKLSGSTGTVIGAYSVDANPLGIMPGINGSIWVIVDSIPSAIVKLNGSTGSVIGTYSIGGIYPQNSSQIAIDSDGNVWIAGGSSGRVVKLDGSTGSIIGAYDVPGWPYSLAAGADSYIWLVNNPSNNVTKLDGSTGAVVGTYGVGSHPHGIAVDADGNIWVVNNGNGSLTELNGSTGGIIENYSAVYVNSGSLGDFTGFALQRFVLGYGLPVSGVAISPSSASLSVGASLQFAATVLRGDGVSGVTWSAPDGGTVADGLFTPPAAAGTYRVAATSVEDESMSATATVTVSASHVLKFGSYSFPGTFHVSSTPSETKVASVEIPRRDGSALGVPRLKERIISVKGMLRGDSPEGLRASMDELLAAVNGGRQRLYLWDDRFIWATKTSFTTDYDDSSFGRYAFAGVDFLCDSPFWESEVLNVDAWVDPASGDTHVLQVGGSAYTMPAFQFTVSGAGQLSIRLSCGDEYFTLSGEVSDGDVIVVDCGAETVVLKSDGSDLMGMFDSSFFCLAGGVGNTVKLTKVSGDPVISQVVTTWRNRWY